MPKIMKTFHSSGTASGNVERMWRWKTIIPATAIVPSVPPLETSSRSGSVNSIDGAHVRRSGADRRRAAGPRVVCDRAVASPGASGSRACC